MSNIVNSSFETFNYFDALFRNSEINAVVLMNKEGIIKAVNPAFTKAFGYDENIIGKHLKLLFTEKDQQRGLPENEIRNVLLKGQCSDNNYLVHKNKTVTWVSGESIQVKNEHGDISILKVIQDINAQKTSENSLGHLSNFNESILTSIDDIIIVLDKDLKIIKINKDISALFKSSNRVSDLSNFAEIVNPYDVHNDLINKIRNAFKTRKGFLNKEIEIATSSGEKRIFDISCTPMKDNTNVLLVAHDITLQRYSERQREDIIGFVAHELRNPLANIVLCNELMSETIEENNPEAVKDLLKRSKNNVMRLNKMIAELYDATKVGSGNMQLDRSSFNFEEMVKEAIETIEVLQPDYKIILSGNADVTVNADRHRLIQVVTNYLSNGIKYSKGSNEVELGMQVDDRDIIVSVKDRGLGISKDQLPYIFNRFFRAEKTKNLEGVGLGLYLCRQIIQAHDGKVWAESEEGKGSTFYFSIPLI